MRTLVLASQSPYRAAQLKQLRLPFTTFKPNIDELPQPNESPTELVQRLAREKAATALSAFPNAIVIGSDQVAVFEGEIIGKPGNYDNAFAQLNRFSGKTIEFLTGVCVLDTATGVFDIRVAPFSVSFRVLSSSQIHNYLKLDQPYDCAGSFKAESLGVALFTKMTGDDINALIGLPLIELVDMLHNAGIAVI